MAQKLTPVTVDFYHALANAMMTWRTPDPKSKLNTESGRICFEFHDGMA
jgi:hypothetical protein